MAPSSGDDGLNDKKAEDDPLTKVERTLNYTDRADLGLAPDQV